MRRLLTYDPSRLGQGPDHVPTPTVPWAQSLPLLGSMSNQSFVLVNGGYEPVITMEVGQTSQPSRRGFVGVDWLIWLVACGAAGA